MVILRVGGFGDTVHEPNAIGEGCEGVRLSQRVAASRPAGQSAEGTLDLEIGEFGSHGARMS